MNNIPVEVIRAAVRQHPEVLPLLNAETRGLLKAAGGYPGVRTEYYTAVYDAVYDYLTGNRPVTGFVNSVKRAFTEAYIEAAEIGYIEAGSELPFDSDIISFLTDAQAKEFGYIEELFSRLKVEWEGLDPDAEATSRAEGYAGTLDQIYSESKLYGAKNKMLTFVGSDGKESCKDCQRMKGQRHKASWWISHNMIPGSSAYECGGWNCGHYLEDDDGNEFTMSSGGSAWQARERETGQNASSAGGGNGSGGSNIQDLEARIFSQDYETAGIYSQDGTLIFEKDGNGNSVGFTSAEVNQMTGGILTHNHPNGSSFSIDDIRLVHNSGLSEIRAVTNDYIYSLEVVRESFYSKKSLEIINDTWKKSLSVASMELAGTNPSNADLSHLAWENFSIFADRDIKIHYTRRVR